MTTIINLTPHELNIQNKNGSMITISPSGTVARVSTTNKVIGEIEGIEITLLVPGQIINLPEPEDYTFYVVSAMVAQAAKRLDVISPGELIRNESGQPIGAKGFTAWID